MGQIVEHRTGCLIDVTDTPRCCQCVGIHRIPGKVFRRIATRYDKLVRNFLASVCLVAAIVWWTS
jgi:hypothetical protein